MRDYFRPIRMLVERYGYVPSEYCKHLEYPTDYRKDNFSIVFALYETIRKDYIPVVYIRYIPDEKLRAECIGTTGNENAFRYKNIPMYIMKKAIHNPSKANTIFNNWEISQVLKDI